MGGIRLKYCTNVSTIKSPFCFLFCFVLSELLSCIFQVPRSIPGHSRGSILLKILLHAIEFHICKKKNNTTFVCDYDECWNCM